MMLYCKLKLGTREFVNNYIPVLAGTTKFARCRRCRKVLRSRDIVFGASVFMDIFFFPGSELSLWLIVNRRGKHRRFDQPLFLILAV